VAWLSREKSEVGFSIWVLATLVGLSLTPVLAKKAVSGVVSMLTGIVGASAIAAFYLVAHAAAGRVWSQVPAASGAATTLGWALVGAGMLGLFAVKTILSLRPQGQLARALYPWLFAGFYLDEHFTRLTFRFWPPRRLQTNSSAVVRNPITAEVSL
jgi:NAD(P)H-quinone oxidoreductase subunit 5